MAVREWETERREGERGIEKREWEGREIWNKRENKIKKQSSIASSSTLWQFSFSLFGI